MDFRTRTFYLILQLFQNTTDIDNFMFDHAILELGYFILLANFIRIILIST